tara:strand:- start:35676 stop:37562 length:1887 start_codon:yes stop_codon:yes gene_type:complete
MLKGENQQLILNPDFKSKVVELKTLASRAFDIQLSIDKLVLDEQYRQTVFDELSCLGNEQISQQIKSLQKIAVYVEVTPPNLNASEQQVSTNSNKLNSLANNKFRDLRGSIHSTIQRTIYVNKVSFITIVLASIIFAFFVLLQTNVLQVSFSSTMTPMTENPALSSVLNSSLTNTITPTKENKQGPESLVAESKSVTPKVITLPILILPIKNAQVSMRLHGSNTIGEHLAPALIEAYLRGLGITEMLWLKGDSKGDRQLQYIFNNKAFVVELYAHGSTTAFKDLLNGEADLAMSSRQIKNQEVESLQAQYGNLTLAGNELIISLDGVVAIVNVNNPLKQLTLLQLSQIFSGEINNWKQLGGKDLVINLYARDSNSGTWDSFKKLVLTALGKELSATAKRYQSSSELSQLVAEDVAGIGFIGLPYINHNKALSIAATEHLNPIYPTHFTVSTEDYPLTRRLYLYVPSSSSQFIKNFTRFVTSSAGQSVVEEVGLVSQNIKLETIYYIKNAPQIYNDYSEIASRVSVNFRFQRDSNQLDNKGQQDLLRLVEYMKENQGRRIVLMGFSDALEGLNNSAELSIKRAKALERELESRGLNITAVEGFGSQLPIASNDTLIGRSKNRRVEVWIF